MSRLPLAGVRVLDSTYVFAMPYAAGLLADLGAEVIKIEAPHRVDLTRHTPLGGLPENDPGARPWDRGGTFNLLNRGKRSLVLDLSRDEGRALFQDLVRISDVVIEAYTARVMRNWGLDYPALRDIKPDIIMLSNSGYGHGGPWESYPVQGTALEPTTGVSHFSGYPDDRPWKIGQSYPDFLACWHALFALAAALYHRRHTGEGQWIDLGMYQLGVTLIGEAILDYTANGRVGGRIGNRDPHAAPQGAYRCAGKDHWLVLSVRRDAEWAALARVMGREDLAQDERFATVSGRRHHHDDLDRILSDWAAEQDAQRMMIALQAMGVPAGVVEDAGDLMCDPHLRARGFYEMVEHASEGGVGRRPLIGRPFRFSDMPLRVRAPAPLFGEGNEYAIKELLGQSDACFSQLLDHRVTASTPELSTPIRSLRTEEMLRLGRLARLDPLYRSRIALDDATSPMGAVAE